MIGAYKVRTKDIAAQIRERTTKKLYRFVIVVAVTAVCQWIMNILNNKVTYHVVNDVRTSAYKKLEQLPLSYVDSHTHGDIVSRVIADVD